MYQSNRLKNKPIYADTIADDVSRLNPSSPTCVDHCAVIFVTVDQNLQGMVTCQRKHEKK